MGNINCFCVKDDESQDQSFLKSAHTELCLGSGTKPAPVPTHQRPSPDPIEAISAAQAPPAKEPEPSSFMKSSSSHLPAGPVLVKNVRVDISPGEQLERFKKPRNFYCVVSLIYTFDDDTQGTTTTTTAEPLKQKKIRVLDVYTSVAKKTWSPSWNTEFLIPAMDRHVLVMFTVIEASRKVSIIRAQVIVPSTDFGSSGSWGLSSSNDVVTYVASLGRTLQIRHTDPLRRFVSPDKKDVVEEEEDPSLGQFSIVLEPLQAHEGACGFVQVCRLVNSKIFHFAAKTHWTDRWASFTPQDGLILINQEYSLDRAEVIPLSLLKEISVRSTTTEEDGQNEPLVQVEYRLTLPKETIVFSLVHADILMRDAPGFVALTSVDTWTNALSVFGAKHDVPVIFESSS